MRRFSFVSLPDEGASFPCPEEQLRHLISVLRIKEGEEIQASCGDGTLAVLKAQSVSSDGLIFKVCSKTQGSECALPASAFLAELKSDAMDEAVSLLAEHGIPHIYPFFAERSVPKFDAKDAQKKLLRRQKLADEAVKKVGGLYSSTVYTSRPLKALSEWDGCPNKIFFDEAEACRGRGLEAFNFSLPTAFAIGPEGGFSPKEREFFLQKLFIPASLGTRILRAPSACSAAAALIRFHTEAL